LTMITMCDVSGWNVYIPVLDGSTSLVHLLLH
jgi:hypothetical protein